MAYSSKDFLSWDDDIDLDNLLGEYTADENEKDTGSVKEKVIYVCPDCDKEYKTISGFRGHSTKKHNKSLKDIGACEQIIAKKNKGDFQEYLQTEHSLLEGSSFRENLNYIEESINRQNSLLQNLKLLCLMSLTNDGIPASSYKSLKTQFVQSHGFEQILTFFNLGKIGMLREQDTSSTAVPGMAALVKNSSFKNLRKRLNLIPSVDVDLRSPCDMSYVFSGAYAPLSCKLVEQVLNRESFAGMEEITKLLPGGVHADVKLRTPGKGKPGNQPGRAAKVVLVYFLGGCTYSEIAALRFLGKQTGFRFIVATTSIFTGNTLLETVMEKSRV